MLSSEHGPTLDLAKAGNGEPGDIITIEARASDGVSSSKAVTTSVTVAPAAGTAAQSGTLDPSAKSS